MPLLLFLTQINGTNYSFLIDKKPNEKYEYPKILIVPYDFDNELYNGGTIQDEEMYIGRVQINLNQGKKRKYLYFQTDYKLVGVND